MAKSKVMKFCLALFAMLISPTLIYSNSEAPQSIGAVGIIKLEIEDLKNLDVTVKNGSATYIETKSKAQDKKIYQKLKIDGKLITGSNLPKNEKPPQTPLHPRFVVCESSLGISSYFSRAGDFEEVVFDDENNIIEYAKANDLVCVYFELESADKKSKSKVYLWYEPSRELKEKLPDEYSSLINIPNEKHQQDELPVSTEINAISGLLVFPNPVLNQSCRMKFKVEDHRNISCAIYDIEGNKIKDIFHNKRFENGEFVENIQLDNFRDGVYMIVIFTDSNESLSQRIIVVNN